MLMPQSYLCFKNHFDKIIKSNDCYYNELSTLFNFCVDTFHWITSERTSTMYKLLYIIDHYYRKKNEIGQLWIRLKISRD